MNVKKEGRRLRVRYLTGFICGDCGHGFATSEPVMRREFGWFRAYHKEHCTGALGEQDRLVFGPPVLPGKEK